MPLEEFLELSSLAMTDPMSGVALVPGGDEIDVTMDNVGDFVEAVTTRWGFRTGRRPSSILLKSIADCSARPPCLPRGARVSSVACGTTGDAGFARVLG